jgi:hypothetical protein
MAIVHRAEITPPKLEIISWWLPSQDWFTEDGPVDREATFRVDDPAGEVGIETFIVRSGSFTFHVPLTYRAEPLDGGLLVGEVEHSVLGHRWVYDGPSDPVYVATTAAVIAGGGHEVDMFFEDGTQLPRQEWAASVSGSGTPGAIVTGSLVVARSLPAPVPSGVPTLDATWAGLDSSVTLAWLA